MRMNLKKGGKAFLSVHEDFFRLDKKEKLARIDLAFRSPSDIFSQTIQADIPIISGDFLALLMNTYDCIPDRYKLDIRVFFDDLEEYSEEYLKELFRKNIMLALRIQSQKTHRRNRLALILCLTGFVFVFLSSWLNRFWTNEGTAKNIIFFILNIVATVPFWGALDICLIDGSERRRTAFNIRKRFNSVSFHRKG